MTLYMQFGVTKCDKTRLNEIQRGYPITFTLILRICEFQGISTLEPHGISNHIHPPLQLHALYKIKSKIPQIPDGV